MRRRVVRLLLCLLILASSGCARTHVRYYDPKTGETIATYTNTALFRQHMQVREEIATDGRTVLHIEALRPGLSPEGRALIGEVVEAAVAGATPP